MEALSFVELVKLAKNHLGLQPYAANSLVPNAYLDELKFHLSLYPHDSSFRVTLDPQRGFGNATCLEQGCNSVSISLTPRVNVFDGGKNDGFGSLSTYRHHIEDHPTHAKNRHVRVKAELAAKRSKGSATPPSKANPFSIKGETNLLSLLDSSSVSHTTSLSEASSGKSQLAYIHQSPKRASSLVRIKPEPVESDFPRKRLSDIAFRSRNGKEGNHSLPHSPSKKLKAEPTHKEPFALVDRNTGSSENIALSAPPSGVAVEETRLKIADLQVQISSLQAALHRLSCKRTKSKADTTRIARYSSDMQRLRREKDDLSSSIPTSNISPIKRTLSRHQLTKSEPSTDYLLPPPSYSPLTQTPIASGSNVRLPPSPGMGAMDTGDEAPSPAVMTRINDIIPTLPQLGGADHFDDNGDFHGRGRDLFVGPQAKADDIDKFLLEAGNAEQFDGNASVDQALEKLGLQSQYDLLPGMEVALMPHQTIGVAWMLDREQSSLKGGCLGDDMGLGKTVQMMALIMQNQSQDPTCKTTLVIAPMALLDQWKLEIEMKTNCDVQCLIYHGSSKPRRKQDLLKYDVVLTTYSTMALEWPDFETEQKRKEKARRQSKKEGFIVEDSDGDSDNLRPRKRRKESGLLFQVDFYRIVLDEAQAIRNKRTRTSRAVTDLRAAYRWCLTGTPIINSIVDVYGYLRFLRIRPWYDWTEFQDHIGRLEKKNPTLAVSRLQAVITSFLLRRMKNSMLDGKRLIELPDKTISLIKLEFSEEEREIYKMVEARTQANFNRYLRAGTVLKNYSQVLVLLLRLRQICAHPSLIQEDGAAYMAPGEVDDDSAAELSTELTRARRLVSLEFVIAMKSKFKASALQRMEAEKESADAVAEDEECPICFDVLTDAVVTPCTHVFCRECLVDVINTPMVNAVQEPPKFKANERPCPACRSPICSGKLFTRAAFVPSDADLLPGNENPEADSNMEMEDCTISAKDRKGKGKPKRAARRLILDSDDVTVSEAESDDEEVGDDMGDFIVEDDEDEEEKDARRELKKRLGKRKALVVLDSDEEREETPEESEVLFGARKAPASDGAIKLMPRFLPSTKMKHMMKQLRQLVEERPDEKTLIVSQWTGCLSLVSDYLAEAGIIHVKYQGDMNRPKRDQAVRVFMSKDKARVMLMSMKCGGVGLNLTRANNVISLDLGWAQAIEAQSFDRVHRLGQTRPVFVQRLVIADTVEDRVLAMQERKQTLADGSLGEGSGKKIGRLSVKELASLFGLDHRGHVLAKN